MYPPHSLLKAPQGRENGNTEIRTILIDVLYSNVRSLSCLLLLHGETDENYDETDETDENYDETYETYETDDETDETYETDATDETYDVLWWRNWYSKLWA